MEAFKASNKEGADRCLKGFTGTTIINLPLEASISVEQNMSRSRKKHMRGHTDVVVRDAIIPMGLTLISAFNPSRIGEETTAEQREEDRGCNYFLRIGKDLHIEILIRIPWKEVNVCKSVSRQWQQLISQPPFFVEHHCRNTSLLGFFYNGDDVIKFTPLTPTSSDYFYPYYNIVQQQVSPYSSLSSYFVTVSASNGLVLHLHASQGFLFMYDPITGQLLRIPRPPHILSEDLLNHFIVYGLAFISSPNHHPHALVVEVLWNNILSMRVHSFSSITCRWESEVHNVPNFLPKGYFLFGQSTFLNGSLHWLVEPSGIIAYNIKTKCFSFINIPNDQVVESCTCRNPGTSRYLGDSQEHLIYVRVTGDIEFSIWILDDYYRTKWSVRHHIVINNNLTGLSRAIPRVLAFDPRNSQIMFIRLARKICSCNLITREIKELPNIITSKSLLLGHIIPYKLPRSYPLAPPYCFSLLFGDSICYKGTNKPIPGDREDLIKLYAHVHGTDNNGMQPQLPFNPTSCDDYFTYPTYRPKMTLMFEWKCHMGRYEFHSEKCYSASTIGKAAARGRFQDVGFGCSASTIGKAAARGCIVRKARSLRRKARSLR